MNEEKKQEVIEEMLNALEIVNQLENAKAIATAKLKEARESISDARKVTDMQQMADCIMYDRIIGVVSTILTSRESDYDLYYELRNRLR